MLSPTMTLQPNEASLMRFFSGVTRQASPFPTLSIWRECLGFAVQHFFLSREERAGLAAASPFPRSLPLLTKESRRRRRRRRLPASCLKSAFKSNTQCSSFPLFLFPSCTQISETSVQIPWNRCAVKESPSVHQSYPEKQLRHRMVRLTC